MKLKDKILSIALISLIISSANYLFFYFGKIDYPIILASLSLFVLSLLAFGLIELIKNKLYKIGGYIRIGIFSLVLAVGQSIFFGYDFYLGVAEFIIIYLASLFVFERFRIIL